MKSMQSYYASCLAFINYHSKQKDKLKYRSQKNLVHFVYIRLIRAKGFNINNCRPRVRKYASFIIVSKLVLRMKKNGGHKFFKELRWKKSKRMGIVCILSRPSYLRGTSARFSHILNSIPHTDKLQIMRARVYIMEAAFMIAQVD